MLPSAKFIVLHFIRLSRGWCENFAKFHGLFTHPAAREKARARPFGRGAGTRGIKGERQLSICFARKAAAMERAFCSSGVGTALFSSLNRATAPATSPAEMMGTAM